MEIELLKKALSSKITPTVKHDEQTKLAAVLIVIYGKEPKIIMTERPKSMNHHAGEISFPGGTWKQDDNDLLTTALRETKEEMNLDVPREQIMGQIKPVTTLNSGFTIIPFICILDEIPQLAPNSEIESILHIPFVSLLKTIKEDLDPTHKSIQGMHTFKYQHYLIWGASARMLKQISDLLSKTGLL